MTEDLCGWKSTSWLLPFIPAILDIRELYYYMYQVNSFPLRKPIVMYHTYIGVYVQQELVHRWIKIATLPSINKLVKEWLEFESVPS